ncbi:MAG: hypothetical protein CVU05_04250 [Bacteroidetes bacterium HGW-Bacteroidetes-21]|jgi:hypothetical protein|nr:MAG: hypothetical protein CVU05_04250 [Bacteroidetes bacterium HGW-Bacteroidetes-21]
MFIVLQFNVSLAQTQYLKYPSYETIVNRFFDKYSPRDYSGTQELRFEKRPAGWFVTVTDYYNPGNKLKADLFWSSEKNKFMPLTFPKKEKNENLEKEHTTFLNDWNSMNYNLCPYYGYPGWEMDMINSYENQKNLPDSIIYALGRAYSSFASNLLNNNTGLADQMLQFELPQTKNSMTAEQLEKYRFYRHKAIEKFDLVTQMNPSLETLIGRIGIKASNEHLTSFLDLRVYQNESEASKELKPGLYNDFYISMAKNYLNSCEKNAILFTNGDNDTYPLLYVQSQLGFRTDVQVVNFSLLMTERYINSFRDSILTAPPLPITFTPEMIAGNNRNIVLITNENENPIDIPSLIEFLKNESHIKDYGTEKYFYCPTHAFSLTSPNGNIEWSNDIPYFFKNHLIMLDMLAANNWERPVYFANTMSQDYYFELSNYFRLDGLAYRLTPEKKPEESYSTGHIDSDLLYNNLMNKFSWQGFDSPSKNELLICLNIRIVFSRLALQLIEENKSDSARKTLDFCMTLMPDKVVHYDYTVLQIIEAYYLLSDIEKANSIALILADNLKKKIDNVSDNKFLVPTDNRALIQQELKRIVEKYGQQGVVKI